jgi:hypothetical protein
MCCIDLNRASRGNAAHSGRFGRRRGNVARRRCPVSALRGAPTIAEHAQNAARRRCRVSALRGARTPAHSHNTAGRLAAHPRCAERGPRTLARLRTRPIGPRALVFAFRGTVGSSVAAPTAGSASARRGIGRAPHGAPSCRPVPCAAGSAPIPGRAGAADSAAPALRSSDHRACSSPWCFCGSGRTPRVTYSKTTVRF